MNCADFESTLADYIDGTLSDAGRTTLEAHAEVCSGCREFMRDVVGAAGLLKRIGDVCPPQELITRIANQTPIGRIRDPFERQSWFSRMAARWLQPMLQPRWVMGLSMAVLSFAMLDRSTGGRVQHISAAEMNPVHVWSGVEERIVRLKDRIFKSYENLRIVYELETRLKDLEQQQEAAQDRNSIQAPAKKPSGASNQSGDRKK